MNEKQHKKLRQAIVKYVESIINDGSAHIKPFLEMEGNKFAELADGNDEMIEEIETTFNELFANLNVALEALN